MRLAPQFFIAILGVASLVAIDPAAPRIVRIGQELQTTLDQHLMVQLPDGSGHLELGPGSRVIVCEGGHEFSLSQGSVTLRPSTPAWFALQTADLKRRAEVRLEGAEGGVLRLELLPNHDVKVHSEKPARVLLAGWPGTQRLLAPGETRLISALAEMPD